jgi:hypothetical protein
MGVWAHNRKVDADARAHRCRQQKVDTGCGQCRNNLCQIQRLRQNSVPIGTLLALMLLTRLITRTGARLLAVPGAVVLLLITPLAALSTSPWVLAALLFVPEGRRIALQSDERSRCARRA